jgi:hypothetical protein
MYMRAGNYSKHVFGFSDVGLGFKLCAEVLGLGKVFEWFWGFGVYLWVQVLSNLKGKELQ